MPDALARLTSDEAFFESDYRDTRAFIGSHRRPERAVQYPLRCWQLKHSRSLAFFEASQKHTGSVRKLDRIMVTVRGIRVERTEFADPDIDCCRADPSVVVFNILLEGELGSWKHTNRDRRITF
ncbi:MAG TPA: hypothetical protein VG168_03135 [Bryobacteraceae bacterium]|nr:hypothetical protein [Bryobacteraceae bacterium]